MRAAEEQHEAERMKLAHRIQQLETSLSETESLAKTLNEENESLHKQLSANHSLQLVADRFDSQITRFAEIAMNDPRLAVAEQRRLLEIDRAELMAVHGDPSLWDRSPLLRAGRLAYAFARGKDADKAAYLRDTGWRESGSGWCEPGTASSEFMPLPMAFQRAAINDLAMFDRMGVREQVTPQRQSPVTGWVSGAVRKIGDEYAEGMALTSPEMRAALNPASEAEVMKAVSDVAEAISNGLRSEREMLSALAPRYESPAPVIESTTFSGDLTSFSTSSPAPRMEIKRPTPIPNEKIEPQPATPVASAKPVRRATMVYQNPGEQRKLEEERRTEKKLRHDPRMSVKATLIRSDEDLRDLPDAAFEE